MIITNNYESIAYKMLCGILSIILLNFSEENRGTLNKSYFRLMTLI